MSGTIDDDFFGSMDAAFEGDDFLSDYNTEPDASDNMQEPDASDNMQEPGTAESEQKGGLDDFFGAFAGSAPKQAAKEETVESTGVAGLDSDPFGDCLFGSSSKPVGRAGLDSNPFGDDLFGENTGAETTTADDGNPFAGLDETNPFADTNSGNPFADNNDTGNPFADNNDTGNPFAGLASGENVEKKKSSPDKDNALADDDNPFW